MTADAVKSILKKYYFIAFSVISDTTKCMMANLQCVRIVNSLCLLKTCFRLIKYHTTAHKYMGPNHSLTETQLIRLTIINI